MQANFNTSKGHKSRREHTRVAERVRGRQESTKAHENRQKRMRATEFTRESLRARERRRECTRVNESARESQERTRLDEIVLEFELWLAYIIV